MIKLRQKGGVYGIVNVPVKKVNRITYTPKYPDNTIITAGHSENIKKRFSGYNKDKVDVEDRVENNLSFILHSPSQAVNGTRILESLFFYHFKEFRISKRQEIFKFQKDFNLEDHFTELCEFFQIRNINDLAIYKCLGDVPYTVSPSSTQVSDNEQGEFTLSPRNDFQKDVIESGLIFYKTEEKGGLYLPPGSGKTFITVLMTLEIPKKKNKPFLILCPRLAICSEWEKCISHTDCSFIVYNSESSTELSSGVRYIITTYQSYLKDIEKFHSINYSMTIYDEAHHVMSGKEYSKSLDIPTLKKLFLTATPTIHRFDEDQDNVITESLDEATYGKAISQLSLHDAIDRQMLCGYRLLIHNKPSQTDCREHIRDLVEKFGRRKIVIFYNRREHAKEAVELLNEVMENIFYIDGDTSKEGREAIFKSFEECDTGVLVNINVLSEGVSIPCIDCILMMDKRNSEKALIQIMGRALRLYPGKDCAVLCIPVDCSDTLETALNALVYDGGSDSRVKGNLIVESENKNVSLAIVDDLEKRLKIIEIGRSGVSMADYKVNLLNDYFLREGELCTYSYIQDDIKLGHFQYNIIQFGIKKNQRYKKEIPLWESTYPELFKYFRDKIEKNKNKSKDISPHDKIKILNDYFIEEGRIATQKYIKDDVKLGIFQQNVIRLGIKEGKRFKKEIPLWERTYPELFREFRNRIQANHDNPHNNTDIDEKVQMLNDYLKDEGAIMDPEYIIEGIKLGKFQQNLIIRGLRDCELYKKKIPLWDIQYPELFKHFRNMIKQIPDKTKIRRTLVTPNDKMKLINEYFEKEGKLIPFKYIKDSINLGDFRADILECLKNKKGYEKYICKWKVKYPKLLEAFTDKNIENQQKKKADISADSKVKILSDYFIREKKLANQQYLEDGVKLGIFQQNLIRLGLHKKQRYKKEIPLWEKTYPELFREFRNRIQNLQYNPPDKTSFDIKVQMLNNYFIKEKKLVSQKYIEDTVKLGTFQSNILKALKTKSLYKKQIPIWEKTYPELFKSLRERVKSISESVSKEDSISIIEESDDNE